jgi:predicted amidophosphoribosyltransferase
MRRDLPPRVARVAELVVELAGAYLRNTMREPGVTCSVCSTPVNPGQRMCPPCRTHENSGIPHADRVASLVYAVEYDTQAYRLVRGYKAVGPGPSQRNLVSSLLAVGLRGHGACEMELAGVTTGHWAVVPSTKRRDRPQPLRELLVDLARPGREITLTPAEGVFNPRELRASNFVVASPPPLPRHVTLIDDSWVRGGHAQSAAAALKAAGVQDVSIFTVARVLDPTWGPNPDFIKKRLVYDFDPVRCPWTGGECP